MMINLDQVKFACDFVHNVPLSYIPKSVPLYREARCLNRFHSVLHALHANAA